MLKIPIDSVMQHPLVARVSRYVSFTRLFPYWPVFNKLGNRDFVFSYSECVRIAFSGNFHKQGTNFSESLRFNESNWINQKWLKFLANISFWEMHSYEKRNRNLSYKCCLFKQIIKVYIQREYRGKVWHKSDKKNVAILQECLILNRLFTCLRNTDINDVFIGKFRQFYTLW